MERPPPAWLRLFLIFVALQAELLVPVLFQPDLVKLFVPFAATPLNARFIAALYVSLGLGVLLAAFASQLRALRLVLIGIGLATALLFLMTLPRLGELNPFPTDWMLFYLVDPLLVLFTFWKLDWRDSPAGGRNPLAPIWILQSIVFGVGGIVLLALPQIAMSLWPWNMTEQLSQLYSMFFITISIISLLAARELRWAGVQPTVFMIAALALLVLVASALHLASFKAGLQTTVWFALFTLEALAFGGLYIRQSLHAPAKVGST